MTLKMAAVGDITLGDHPMCVGFGAYSHFKDKSVDYPFEHVKSEFKKYDFVFGNLECAHSEKGLIKNDYDSIQMRGKPSDLKGLKDAGIKVVNFATNHSMQHGTKPFLETLELLKKSDIKYCGVSPENHLQSETVILEIKGIKLGFLGYSLRPRQYFDQAPLYTEGKPENILNDIGNLKMKVDHVILSLHWGDEFIQKPSPEEIMLARECIDSGANLIIGHHPHVLRGIEKYKQGYIAYSLGNFVCDMIWDDKLRESLILTIEFTKQCITKLDYLPVFINDNYQPVILNSETGKKLINTIETLSNNIKKEDLSEIDSKLENYIRDADEFQRLYRTKAHKYFIRNIYRFPFKILIQQIKTYLMNRLDEIFKFRNN